MSEKEGSSFSQESTEGESSYEGHVAVFEHEARNCLSLVLGKAQLLEILMRSSPTVTPTMVAAVQTIVRESRNLGSLLMDLRMGEGEFVLRSRFLDMRPILYATAEAAATFSPVHNLIVDAPEDLPQVFADEERIDLVLRNLVLNAIKYSPKGGEVKISGAEEGDLVKVSVKDQGLGVPLEERERIFDRFYRIQTGEHFGIRGTGIGLNNVKRIIDAHGGRAWVESAGVDKGSTFYFTLPQAEK